VRVFRSKLEAEESRTHRLDVTRRRGASRGGQVVSEGKKVETV
jgi:hypothetical protein